jgi:hypothetical protein
MLLVQLCSLIQAEAAQNEMDALALAEVLVPCMAWKPAKPPGAGGPGPWQGLAKALTLNKASGAAAAAGLQPGGTEAAAGAGAGGEGEAAAAGQQGPLADEQQQQQQLEEASRVQPLDDAELEAVVRVVEFMISNFAGVFVGHSSSSQGGSHAGAPF